MYEHMHVHLHAIYTVLYIVQCSYMDIILHSILNKKNISDKTIYPIVHYIINTVCYIFYYIYPTYMYTVYIYTCIYTAHYLRFGCASRTSNVSASMTVSPSTAGTLMLSSSSNWSAVVTSSGVQLSAGDSLTTIILYRKIIISHNVYNIIVVSVSFRGGGGKPWEIPP